MLGDAVDAAGLHTTKIKLLRVLSVSVAKSVSEIKSCVGFHGYHKLLVPYDTRVSAALLLLCKKDAVLVWGAEQGTAFTTPKTARTSALVLAFPDLKSPSCSLLMLRVHLLVLYLCKKKNKSSKSSHCLCKSYIKSGADSRYSITI